MKRKFGQAGALLWLECGYEGEEKAKTKTQDVDDAKESVVSTE